MRNLDVMSETGLSTHYFILLTGDPGSGKSYCIRQATADYDTVNLGTLLDDYGHVNHSLFFQGPSELGDEHLDKNVKVLILEDVESFPKATIQKLATALAPIVKRKTVHGELRLNPMIFTTSNSYDPNVGVLAGKLGLRRHGKKPSATSCTVEYICETPSEAECYKFGRALMKAYSLPSTSVDLLPTTNLRVVTHQVYHAALCDLETHTQPSAQEIPLMDAWKYVTQQTNELDKFERYDVAWQRAPSILKHLMWNSYLHCVDDVAQAGEVAETWSLCDLFPYDDADDVTTSYYRRALHQTFRNVKPKFRKGFALTKEPPRPDLKGFSWGDVEMFRELFAIKSCATTEDDDKAYSLANFLREWCTTLHNVDCSEPNTLTNNEDYIGVWTKEDIASIAKMVTHRFV